MFLVQRRIALPYLIRVYRYLTKGNDDDYIYLYWHGGFEPDWKEFDERNPGCLNRLRMFKTVAEAAYAVDYHFKEIQRTCNSSDELKIVAFKDIYKIVV